MSDSTNLSAAASTPAPRQADTHPKRFRLTGPSRPFDPTHHAIRSDLADIAEAEFHFAPHYALTSVWHTTRAVPLLAKPRSDAEIRGELPAGADFALLDITGAWAWGYALDGHRVGYLAADALAHAD